MSTPDRQRWAKVHTDADRRQPLRRHGCAPLHRRPEIVLPLLWLVLLFVPAVSWMTWGQG